MLTRGTPVWSTVFSGQFGMPSELGVVRHGQCWNPGSTVAGTSEAHSFTTLVPNVRVLVRFWAQLVRTSVRVKKSIAFVTRYG